MTEKGVEFESVNYIRKPLKEKELNNLLHRVRLRPHEVIRTKEAAYQQYVAGRNLNDKELLRIMAEHPELIQRPIVVRGKKAVLARPVQRLEKLGIK